MISLRKPLLLCLLAAPLVWTGCAGGSGGDAAADAADSPFGPTGIPPQLRPRGGSQAGAAPTVALPQGEGGEPLQFTPEEDIMFTDPDNPDAILPELSNILSTTPKKRGAWEESETIAKKRSAREGKPLLIWFTNSAKSPMCKALDQELFSTSDFKRWAGDNLIRLKVDENVSATDFVNDPDISLDDKETRRIDAINYVKRLKKQYKALGYPSVMVLNPDGGVVGRYRGYSRGEAEVYWGRIKHAVAASNHSHEAWRKSLENKGYREWNDRRGRSIFAKLAGYKDGTLVLIEPDGTRCKTHEDKLSKEDRDWIDEQKRLRGL